MLSFVSLCFALVAGAIGGELPKNEEVGARLYDTGYIHETIMAKKHATWDRQRAAGVMQSNRYPEIASKVRCVDGTAVVPPGGQLNTFRCKGIDLIHFLSHAELGSATGEGSSTWGWTSPGGREFIALGQADGTAFLEINKQGKMVYLGRLPTNSVPAIWREIRGYRNYMVIGSEAVGHNIQLFDMTKLLNVDPASPTVFSNLTDVTGHFTDLPIGRTHNVVTNEEAGWAYSVGAAPRNSTCKAGLIFIDLKDPSNPTSPGCNADDGYVHDAQCVIYRGPDFKYWGREICYGYNEDTLTIYDVTDKSKSTIISRTSYEGANYTHQGWLLDQKWQKYLVLDDEYDEYEKIEPAADGHPVTYIWDVSNLDKPKNTGYFKNTNAHSVDHNQYVIDGFAFQSNYGSGFRVLDLRSIPDDPTGGGVEEVAFFDIYPEDDSTPGGGVIDFVGTWGSYAYFKSGYIFVNTIERGGFVLKLQKPLPRGFSARR
ncbi:hypothetical protein P152DRAFT_483300 [Eremomyces bilateralis CBS 781.70]|uniref:Regulatory P domain-containing protein n=1 Tax=Eremomyces bilateralis CBS 781.70 TaxID=1392243 RepID=A0A6G1FZ41_9PEZI|nr:uncharacterized protein P152DRAFT_483300 [Eremomyces bilateralis CBS 781.70]KAF1810961.1 hypothetical protein P152DRAFT_483300 [Eremomyces bilateralis CBS 781.70]